MENKRLKGLLLSAYDAGSHKYWRTGIVAGLSDIEWTVLSLPARFFSWRIRGNPISFISKYSFELAQDYDFMLVTSVVDLAALKGLLPNLSTLPTVVYFHENQFEYPKSQRQHSLLEAQMVNMYSAMAADHILFNSQFNQKTFLQGCDRLMAKLPDFTLTDLATQLELKSSVIPVPIADHFFASVREGMLSNASVKILWNHRWEYDKGPDRLLLFLIELKARNVAFEINIVGEQFRVVPPEFDKIQTLFSAHIANFGYLESINNYSRLLSECDIVLSTSIHEFQGVSVMEAVAAGCFPLVPSRLSYLEYIDRSYCYESNIDDPETEAISAVDTLLKIMARQETSAFMRKQFQQFTWRELINPYRNTIKSVLTK